MIYSLFITWQIQRKLLFHQLRQRITSDNKFFKLLLYKVKHYSLSARVGEKSNYLEVESNKFLKFRQDYNELGKFVLKVQIPISRVSFSYHR